MRIQKSLEGWICFQYTEESLEKRQMEAQACSGNEKARRDTEVTQEGMEGKPLTNMAKAPL